MKIEYLQSGSLTDLEHQVNDHLAQGWTLQGNLLSWSEAPDNSNPTYFITWFVQAVLHESLPNYGG